MRMWHSWEQCSFDSDGKREKVGDVSVAMAKVPRQVDGLRTYIVLVSPYYAMMHPLFRPIQTKDDKLGRLPSSPGPSRFSVCAPNLGGNLEAIL